jgi:hypothetical protein
MPPLFEITKKADLSKAKWQEYRHKNCKGSGVGKALTNFSAKVYGQSYKTLDEAEKKIVAPAKALIAALTKAKTTADAIKAKDDPDSDGHTKKNTICTIIIFRNEIRSAVVSVLSSTAKSSVALMNYSKIERLSDTAGMTETKDFMADVTKAGKGGKPGGEDAQAIFNEFIASGSPKEINIVYRQRAILTDQAAADEWNNMNFITALNEMITLFDNNKVGIIGRMADNIGITYPTYNKAGMNP